MLFALSVAFGLTPPARVATKISSTASPWLDVVEPRLSFETVEEDGKAQQSPLGLVLDSAFSWVFGALHVVDDTGIQDSSKNLRVLWARAVLAANGEIDDKVAASLLPSLTRGVVTWDVWRPWVKFLEFVTSRTRFIDKALDQFLASHERARVVVVGAGYDTRAMRYAGRADFIEIDAPDVVEGKAKLWDKFPELQRPKFVAHDLNGEDGLLDVLGDLDDDVPTLFIVEAVLFYVDDRPTRRFFDEITSLSNAALVLTDSLKPVLTSPFTHDARRRFSEKGWDLLDHEARWGGAVHFAVAAAPGAWPSFDKVESEVSFFPVASAGAAKKWKQPSFENAWYAVCYASQLDETSSEADGVAPYATRLFGEPMVLFRDSQQNIVCLADACPHRAAPLSMGRVSDGALACFYHGWAFSTDGRRVDGDGAACKAKSYAAVERDGIVYVWRGESVLTADPSLLPAASPRGTPTHAVDTILDYGVSFEYIVENNLDSFHLFHLHDGSIPPIASLGMTRLNAHRLKTAFFQDNVGVGHVGVIDGAARPNKLIRFDAPNIVRHAGVSGFHEEFHIVPIAPGRTRVLLRQYLPKGPILSTLLDIPGFRSGLKVLVNAWNYHVGLEDYSVMVGQAKTIDDLGAPRLNRAGPGDDLIAKFYQWRDKALASDGGHPYFTSWVPQPDKSTDRLDWSHARPRPEDARVAYDDLLNKAPASRDSFFGIRETYHPDHPVAHFPPANPRPYIWFWRAHSIANKILGQEPNAHTRMPFERRRKDDAAPSSDTGNFTSVLA